MTIKIKKDILKYSQNIYPYYSKSAILKNKEFVSTNALIYHGLINLHLGNKIKAKNITKICIKNFKKEKKYISKNTLNKHSQTYKDFHKIALFSQLFFSVDENFKSIKSLYKDILSKRNYLLISNERLFIKEIKSLSLKNSWHDSNIIMAMFTLRFAFCSGNKKDKGLNKCIDYLETIQNRKTGLWHSKNGFGGDLNAMAGTYHYIPLFLSIDRRIPYTKNIINSTSRLYINNGHFSAPKGHSCIDLDAFSIFYYCKNNKENNSIFKIKNCSKDFINDLYNISNKDGGFSDFPSNYKFKELISSIIIIIFKLIIYKNAYNFLWNIKSIFRTLPYIKQKLKITSNSDYLCSSYIKESNIFSCWFKLLNIDIALKLYKKVTNNRPDPIYKLPFIGYGI